ncbi:MAG: mechanosensitive ion channel family protein [Deltaproteobacteria bacterium]|nr:mechanosensitive ion channel family protein [Deltaproteobacteria bacterium]
MSFDFTDVSSLSLLLGIVLVAILAGLIAQRVILSRLRKIAAKTKWKGDDVIINALKGGVVYLFLELYSGRFKDAIPQSTIFKSLTKIVIVSIGFLIILQTYGISITPILTAFGIGGLAVALALQDTLSNLFSGIQIILSKQVKTGDYIKLESGEEGYVMDITWRNTTIRMLPNNIVIIPNSKLASIIITNFCLPAKEMSLLIQVGVSYDSDLEKVEKVTIDVAREVMKTLAGGVTEFDPFIRYHTFDDFSINFTVILRAREFVDQYLLKHEFVKRLHERYNKEGIEIPFPIRTVHLNQPAHDSKFNE